MDYNFADEFIETKCFHDLKVLHSKIFSLVINCNVEFSEMMTIAHNIQWEPVNLFITEVEEKNILDERSSKLQKLLYNFEKQYFHNQIYNECYRCNGSHFQVKHICLFCSGYYKGDAKLQDFKKLFIVDGNCMICNGQKEVVLIYKYVVDYFKADTVIKLNTNSYDKFKINYSAIEDDASRYLFKKHQIIENLHFKVIKINGVELSHREVYYNGILESYLSISGNRANAFGNDFSNFLNKNVYDVK